MVTRIRLVAAVLLVSCVVLLTACTGGPRDIRVTSVTEVDFKDQPQLQWVSLKARPSIIISRIDFTTKTDLLALAKAHEYHVDFAVGLCSKDGVQNTVDPYGGPFWGTVRIDSGTKATPDYAAAMAKGPPFTYQVYVKDLRQFATQGPMCLALDGGAMIGGKLRSNVAVVPLGPTHQ